jgi:hypothetical protein
LRYFEFSNILCVLYAYELCFLQVYCLQEFEKKWAKADVADPAVPPSASVGAEAPLVGTKDAEEVVPLAPPLTQV